MANAYMFPWFKFFFMLSTLDPSTLCTMSFPQILAVGAEPLLTRLNMNGDIISQIQCAPQSAFSISLHSSGVCSLLLHNIDVM